jgi:hypothetical protein
MKPTADDVLTVLDLIAARVPDRHITPDPGMAVSWLEDLRRFDRAAVMRAAREWGGLRFPSTHEFVTACQESARAIALEEQAQHHRGELPVGECGEGCEGGWVNTVEVHLGANYKFTRPCEACLGLPQQRSPPDMRHHPIPILRNRAFVALLAVLTVATLALVYVQPARSQEPPAGPPDMVCVEAAAGFLCTLSGQPIERDDPAPASGDEHAGAGDGDAKPIPAVVEPAFTG